MAVSIVPHDPHWSSVFADEAKAIRIALGAAAIDIHHIGSTAIPGILAKPIIDILGVVSSLAATDQAAERMHTLGYDAKGENGIPGRRYFRKSDQRGNRTHHLHVFETGSPHIERHLAFRDFLIAHPGKAALYSEAKTVLAGVSPSRQAYQEGKEPLIAALEQEAIAWRRRHARLGEDAPR